MLKLRSLGAVRTIGPALVQLGTASIEMEWPTYHISHAAHGSQRVVGHPENGDSEQTGLCLVKWQGPDKGLLTLLKRAVQGPGYL